MVTTDKMKQHVFFVDDEPRVRKTVGKTLERLGLKVSSFGSARDCLEKLSSERCDLLITDVKMPEMSGVELLAEVKRSVPWVPVLLVTGYGDIPMAINALKMGALSFIEKPLETQSFLSAVESALDRTMPFNLLLGKQLTQAEIKVLRLIVDGKSNNKTAQILHRSVKTVEVHRSRIMRKLGVDNAVDLLKRATAMGLVDLQPE
ncbi:response regulator transcription factor [Planctomycetota bacterium]